jgi:hypothetical protein
MGCPWANGERSMSWSASNCNFRAHGRIELAQPLARDGLDTVVGARDGTHDGAGGVGVPALVHRRNQTLLEGRRGEQKCSTVCMVSTT